MTNEKKIKILRNAIINILGDAQHCANPLPIIKATCKNVLDETGEDIFYPTSAVHCQVHNWYGEGDDKCPICKTMTSMGVGLNLPL